MMSEDVETLVLAFPYHQTLSDYTGPDPDNVIVREVDFMIDSDGFCLYFSRGRDFSLRQAGTNFESILEDVRRDRFVFHKRRPFLDAPYRSPLSLSNDKLSHVIYKLKTVANMQFWQKGWPISIGDEGNARQAYYKAHKVSPTGQTNQGNSGDPALPYCKVAHMIADGTKYTSVARWHAMNLHIELIFKDDNNQDSFVPLIVDPDIRYPGGSVSEGP